MRATCLLSADGEPEWRSVEADFAAGTMTLLNAEPSAPYLVPGLIDCHCHGVAGMDVMEGSTGDIAAELRSRGIEWFLPTTVTASWESLRKALRSVDLSATGVAGVHLEGPFINPARAGAQPLCDVQPPSWAALKAELGGYLHLLKVATLAPEVPGGLELVSSLQDAGIAASAGHTDADYKTLMEARDRGLRRMTHFFNAMKPFSHRDPGAVGFGLLEDVACELIYDRVHVSREAALLLWRCRGPVDVIAVSDGTKLSGMPEGAEAEMWGHQVRSERGAIRTRNGVLAGSCITLADAFQMLWQDIGKTAAALACSVNPRRLLGLPAAQLWLAVAEDGSLLGLHDGNLGLVV